MNFIAEMRAALGEVWPHADDLDASAVLNKLEDQSLKVVPEATTCGSSSLIGRRTAYTIRCDCGFKCDDLPNTKVAQAVERAHQAGLLS